MGAPTLRSRLVTAMARTLFVHAYAQAVEEAGRERELGPGSGGAWFMVAPDTPEVFRSAAWEYLGRLRQANNLAPEVIFWRAAMADGVDPQEKLDDAYIASFGSDLVMMALGTGVSWFDDHAEFDLVVPDVEAPDAHEFLPPERRCARFTRLLQRAVPVADVSSPEC